MTHEALAKRFVSAFDLMDYEEEEAAEELEHLLGVVYKEGFNKAVTAFAQDQSATFIHGMTGEQIANWLKTIGSV